MIRIAEYAQSITNPVRTGANMCNTSINYSITFLSKNFTDQYICSENWPHDHLQSQQNKLLLQAY